MFATSYFRRLFIPYLLLICLAIGIVGVVAARRLRSSFMERTELALRNQSALTARLLEPRLTSSDPAALQTQVSALGKDIACRITVIRGDGVVIADNEADPATMENHRTRPEVLAAAAGGLGTSIRPSATVHVDLLYFARRLRAADGSVYYIRLAVHLAELNRHLDALYAGIAVAALLAMAGAALIAYFVARRQAKPVIELTAFAGALAHGDLDRRIYRPETGEMRALAESLNAMAESLAAMLSAAAKGEAQLLAILSSMAEGVIATDTRQRIVQSNSAAASLLELPADMSGKMLWEAVRNEEILRAAGEVLRGKAQETYQVGPVGGRYLDVTLRTFPANAPTEGLVIVLHDATQSVRYQELRKEFVANVSHELRTPLTAIKGFAETLRDGALADPQKAPRYLAIIESHADQLTNLVSDLLQLSRLDSHPELPRWRSVDLIQTARKVVDLLQPMAAKKKQQLTAQFAMPSLCVPGDPDYLERAISNLVENAVKYTPDLGTITLDARMTADAAFALVTITDSGLGIPEADIPRIFERFYRVDRSRSRDMGGTGLGLSIVKHIAQAHRGSVEVSSVVGKGSTFTLKLPLSNDATGS